jgi:SAM-dependent methyltransferase
MDLEAERVKIDRGEGHQPWSDERIAALYDVFPFEADISLYTRLAAQQGGRVLELGCGTGRVLLPLVRAGNHVTGVDASPAMLDLARQKLQAAATEIGSRAHLVPGDMRSFELDHSFDLAIIAVKSFAYILDRAEQQAALQRIVRHLRPGGLLALDLLHPTPSWLAREPGSVHQDIAGYVPGLQAMVVRTETTVSTDRARQVRAIRSVYEIVSDGGDVHKHVAEWQYRWLHRFEAEHLLERSGFVVEAVNGGYAGELFTSESPLMLFLARKPDS